MRQRTVFQAAAIDDVPIDVLAERYGSTRGAIYKILHVALNVFTNYLNNVSGTAIDFPLVALDAAA